MEREETEKWVQSLKPGDIVVNLCGWGNQDVTVATVKKVTPSGIVRTDKGSFKQSNWGSGAVISYGGLSGKIAPATEDLLAEARKQDAERAEAHRKQRTIHKAQRLVRELYEKSSEMTFEDAVKVIHFIEEVLQK